MKTKEQELLEREKLEQAAEEYSDINLYDLWDTVDFRTGIEYAFIAGARWQKEQGGLANKKEQPPNN